MPQRRVFGDAPQFPFYDLRDVLLDLRIIASDDLLHTIHAVGIAERGYFRDRNVRSRLSGEPSPVDDDLGVEDLLFDAFVEVVRHGTHEHALREVEIFEAGIRLSSLRVGRGGEVVVAQRVGGPQLHDPAEALAQRLGRISQNLTCEDVAHGILDDLGLLLAVVAFEPARSPESFRHTATLFERAVAIRLSNPGNRSWAGSSMMIDDLSFPFLLMSRTIREL